ncbi:unnamed protein product [Brassica napus]|uniref:(rape) hypothetical protein n=1 Tax=Brassica napus TaxID=3708 RepID=A0A816K4X8_BRANA|nr:unnamed protein product [Brassica napus]
MRLSFRIAFFVFSQIGLYYNNNNNNNRGLQQQQRFTIRPNMRLKPKGQD